ncbi:MULTISPECIES: NUDIX domain-containing protein [unclassified Streptomyces]|uniref:NUDIX domain-containing protein n=1 Tax=unclassified Streptomyces TaxID=2593676 RepID=UPI0033CDA8A6
MTGIVIEDGQILLLDQDTDGARSSSPPGGKVENGETLADALVREMREEQASTSRSAVSSICVTTHGLPLLTSPSRPTGSAGNSGRSRKPRIHVRSSRM